MDGNSQIETALFDTLKTTDDANDLIVKLESVAAKAYTRGFSPEKEIEANFGSRVGRLLRTAPITATIRRIKELPVVEVRTPVSLPEKSERKIANWLEQNAGRKVLVDYQVGRSLLAGVEVYYNGKFVDISLRKAIENKLDELV